MMPPSISTTRRSSARSLTRTLAQPARIAVVGAFQKGFSGRHIVRTATGELRNAGCGIKRTGKSPRPISLKHISLAALQGRARLFR